MKQLLIAVIFCLVGCSDKPKSDNPHDMTWIPEKLSKEDSIRGQGHRMDPAEFDRHWAETKEVGNDSLKLYGHVYDDDALNYIIACGADSILGKYNWRRLDNGDIEYFDKKWVLVLPPDATHAGIRRWIKCDTCCQFGDTGKLPKVSYRVIGEKKKHSTSARIVDDGLEIYNGKEWIKIPWNKYYDSADIGSYGNHGEKIKP